MADLTVESKGLIVNFNTNDVVSEDPLHFIIYKGSIEQRNADHPSTHSTCYILEVLNVAIHELLIGASLRTSPVFIKVFGSSGSYYFLEPFDTSATFVSLLEKMKQDENFMDEYGFLTPDASMLIRNLLVMVTESIHSNLDLHIKGNHMFVIGGKVKILFVRNDATRTRHFRMNSFFKDEVFDDQDLSPQLDHFVNLESHVGLKYQYHPALLSHQEIATFQLTKRDVAHKTAVGRGGDFALNNEFGVYNGGEKKMLADWTFHISKGSVIDTVLLFPFLIRTSKMLVNSSCQEERTLYGSELRNIVYDMYNDYASEAFYKKYIDMRRSKFAGLVSEKELAKGFLNYCVGERLRKGSFVKPDAVDAEDITVPYDGTAASMFDLVRNVAAHVGGSGSLVFEEYQNLNRQTSDDLNQKETRVRDDFKNLPRIHHEMEDMYQGLYLCMMWRCVAEEEFRKGL